MELIQSDTPAQVAVQRLYHLLVETDEDVLLLVSGGSWFSVLSTFPEEEIEVIFNKRITIGLVDERYTHEPVVNNFTQLQATDFYRHTAAAGCQYIDSRVQSGESFVDYTERFADAIRVWAENHPAGVVIATLGMGLDGHTAGIFVDSPARTSLDWVVGYEVPPAVNMHPFRTTVTTHFLETQVAHLVVYVSGVDKCAVLEKVLTRTDEEVDYPAAVWWNVSDAVVVTDCHLVGGIET